MAQGLRDYYDVLGVQRQADEREIKRAYRTQARRLHPDASGSTETREGFHELVEAYRVLSNPRSRTLYDRLGFGRGRPRAPQEPIAAEVELDYYAARLGATVELRVSAGRPCGECVRAPVCPTCAGSGRLRRTAEDDELLLLQLVDCPDCVRGRVVCDACGGSGVVAGTRDVRVRIPLGVRDGERLRVANVPGLIRVRVRPRPADPKLVRIAAAAVLLVAVGLLVYVLVR